MAFRDKLLVIVLLFILGLFNWKAVVFHNKLTCTE